MAALEGQTFHYIFADPPYNKNLVCHTLSCIFGYGLLDSDGLIIMEHCRQEPIADDPAYEVIREKTYGKETRVSFICRRFPIAVSCYLLVKLQTTLERFSTRLDDLIVELRKGYYTATVQP